MSSYMSDSASEKNGNPPGIGPGSPSSGFRDILLRGGRLTKVAGMVASYAPALGRPGAALLSGASLTGLVAGAFLGLTASDALAACTIAPNTATVVCSAEIEDHLRFDDEENPISVTVTPSARISLSSTPNNFDGVFNLKQSGAGGIVFTQLAGGGELAFPGKVIRAENKDAGDISITTVGDVVRSVDGNGDPVVLATNANDSGGAIRLNLGSVRLLDGRGHAVVAQNLGTGATTITATGELRSGPTGGDGLNVCDGGRCFDGDATTSSVNISVGTVTGAWMGMQLEHKGGGDFSVVATGAVTATGSGAEDDGINFKNQRVSATSNVTFALRDVAAKSSNAKSDAIFVWQQTKGDVKITAREVSAAGGHGIFVRTDTNLITPPATTDITLTGDLVVTGTHNPSNATDIANKSGTYALRVHTGIFAGAVNIDLINVRSTKRGIKIDSDARGNQPGRDVSIDVSGSLTASDGAGIHVKGARAATISVSGEVSAGGDGDGVRFESEHDRGTTSEASLGINVASVTGAKTGVHIDHQGGGDVSVAATGTVTGKGSKGGIYLRSRAGESGVTISAKDVVAEGASSNNDNAHALHVKQESQGHVDVSVRNARAKDGHGIYVDNSGSGNVDVGVSGDVMGGTGANMHGVFVKNATSGGEISIEVGGSVTAGGSGLRVESSASATIDVEMSGLVASTGTAANSHAVSVSGSTGDIDVSTGVVSASGGGGIVVETSGSANIRLIAAGSVTSAGTAESSHGISATGSGGDLYVRAGDVSVSGGSALHAHNSGAGDVEVRASGALTAMGTTANSRGIHVTNSGSGGDVDVVAVSVSAKTGAGISVNSSGSGSIAVSAAGLVASYGTAATSSGIHVRNGASGDEVSVSAQTVSATGGAAIFVDSDSSGGGVSVDVSGSVTSTGAGAGAHGVTVEAAGGGVAISAVDVSVVGGAGVRAIDSGAGDLSVDVSGSVTATGTGSGSHGIFAKNDNGGMRVGANRVSAVGGTGILATGTEGVEIRAGAISGDVGIKVMNASGGDVVVVASGTVEGVGTGTGESGSGIRVSHQGSSGDISISANAVTSSGGDGIDVASSASGAVGISVSGQVTAAGTGGDDHGIGVDANGDVSVTAGTVVASGGSGVLVDNSGSGAISVAAAGGVTGGTYGVNLSNSGGGTVSVSGGAFESTMSGSVDDDSQVKTSPAAIAVYSDASGGSVTIEASTVSGGQHGIWVNQKGTGGVTVTAAGTVEGAASGKHAVYVKNDNASGSAVSVSVDGASGGGRGISVDSSANATLTISASGDVEGKGGIGVFANNSTSGNVSVQVGGDVKAGSAPAHHGVQASKGDGAGGVSVSVVGTVEAGGHGIYAKQDGSGAVTITAGGAVTGGMGDGPQHGIFVKTGSTADGGVMIAAGDVATEGSGAADGLHLALSGDGAAAVSAARVSAGTDGRHAIFVKNDGTGSVSITLAGAVTGGGSNAAVKIEGATSAKADLTLESGATVGVAGKLAVEETDGDAMVSVGTGATIAGSVTLGGGDDVLILAGGAVSGAIEFGGGSEDTLRVTGASSVDLATVSGMELLDVTADGVATVSGSLANTKLKVAGILDLSSLANPSNANHTVGELTGGGTVKLDVTDAATKDMLTINGTVSDTTFIDVAHDGDGNPLDGSGAASATVVEVMGAGSGTVGAGSFAVSRAIDGIFGIAMYETASSKKFNLTTISTTGCETSGGTVVCHTLTESVVRSGDGASNVVVELRGGSSAKAASGAVFDLTHSGTGGIEFSQPAGAGIISGTAGHGISAANTGGGAVTITSTGSVSGGGAGSDGIRATNDSSGASVTIMAGTVSGARHGIWAQNEGTGDLRISASGPVTGSSGHGIHADSSGGGLVAVSASGAVTGSGDSSDGISAKGDSRGAGISIAAVAVTGVRHGIMANNSGAGAVSVSVDGAVSAGDGGDGINVENVGDSASADSSVTVLVTGSVSAGDVGIRAKNQGGGGLVVRSADVTGDGFAIHAQNQSGGSVSVDAAGVVMASGTGSATAAIHAENMSGGANLAVSAGTVTGANHGIWAINRGTGFATVSVAGSTVGTAGDGIYALNAGASDSGSSLTIDAGAAVTGGDRGIWAKNDGGGDLVIRAMAVTGSSYGIRAENAGGGAVSIRASGAVTGNGSATEHAGVFASNRVLGTDVSIMVTTVSGQSHGIWAKNSGTGATSVTASGSVSGRRHGIYAYNVGGASGRNSLTISAGAAVTGGADGIRAHIVGDGMLAIDAGTVTGADSGIHAQADGTGGVSITVSGMVMGTGSGTEHAGIRAASARGGGASVTAATVSGESHGIWVKSTGSGAVSLSASGDVTGDAGHGIYAYGSEALSVSASAAVSGGKSGIQAQGRGGGAVSVTVAGLVTANGSSTGDAGIFVVNHGSAADVADITITAAAVTSSGHGIWASGSGAGMVGVMATGAVEGMNAGHGIHAQGSLGASLTVDARAAVTGGGSGIQAVVDGPGTVSVMAGGVVTAKGSGTEHAGIRAVNHGSAAESADIRISAATVTSSGHGVWASGSGTGMIDVTTTGSVTSANGGHGIHAHGGLGASLTVSAGAPVTGDADGISATGAGAGDVVVRAGAVTGKNSGIRVDADGPGSVTVMASGAVVGMGSGTTHAGIFAENSGASASLSINADSTVSSSGHGIWAAGSGVGTVGVVAAQTVSGGRHGIAASVAGSSLTIDARAAVMGGADGVNVSGSGSGSISVQVRGVTGADSGISVRAEGGGNVAIVASDAVTANGSGTDHAGVHANVRDGSGVSIRVAAVTGARSGVVAVSSGTGGVSVIASGEITGRGDDGIHAESSGGAVEISATDMVEGERRGISARSGGAGSISITASDTVTSTGSVTGSAGIYAFSDAAGTGVTVSAQSVVGSFAGISVVNAGGGTTITATSVSGSGAEARYGVHVVSTGNGAVSIDASSGSVSSGGVGAAGSQASPAGISVYQGDRGGRVTVTAANVSGAASGVWVRSRSAAGAIVAATGTITAAAGHGIHAVSEGGDVTVNVTGTVTGGTGAGQAAISTDAGGTAKVTLESGASVGAAGRVAILDGPGASAITAKAGATVTGSVTLGDGADTFTISGGDVSAVEKFDGGDGTDVLLVSKGTHAFEAENLLSWEQIAVGGGGDDDEEATIKLAGTTTLETGNLEVRKTGTLSLGADSGEYSELTVSGNFAGGGTLSINTHLVRDLSDKLIVTGDVSGVTSIDISDKSGAAPDLWIDIVEVSGSVSEDAFTLTGVIDYAFDLQFQQASKTFQISKKRPGVCTGTATETCSGVFFATKTFTSSGTQGLDVSLDGTALFFVDSGAAIELTHTGSGGISLNQADGGQQISGAASGVKVTNSSGGAVSIALTGEVGGSGTGTGDAGILVVNGATSDRTVGGVTVTAATVTGGKDGIHVKNWSSAGATVVTATGTVSGGADDGIHIDAANSETNVTVVAADVSGGRRGIFVRSDGERRVSVTSSGSVVGSADSGIHVRSFNGGDVEVVASGTVVGSGTMSSHAGIKVEFEGSNIGSRKTNASVKAARVTGSFTGIHASADGQGSVDVVATGAVIGRGGRGIDVAVKNAGGNSVSVSAAAVTGKTDGIKALNAGSGALSVAATGTVRGSDEHGISANSTGAGGITISAVGVSGGKIGIHADNGGTGSVSVTAVGDVTGRTDEGIRADGGSQGSGVAVSAATVTGETSGIGATNGGTGDLSIEATGVVTGRTEAGIFGSATGAGAGDMTVSAATVAGQTFGIKATNSGSGSLSVTATGAVTGTAESGISATASHSSAGNLTVSAATVTGEKSGIVATSSGSGNLSVTSTQAVTGRTESGISASAAGSGGNLTVSAAAVTGQAHGIKATSSGSGSLSVTAAGAVAGTDEHGIHAANSSSGNGIAVVASEVSGGNDGINVQNMGSGALSVTVSRTAVGRSGRGIHAKNAASADGLTVRTVGASGAKAGIIADNGGTGDLTVEAAGLIDATDGEAIKAVNAGAGSILVKISGTARTAGADAIFAMGSGATSISLEAGARIEAGDRTAIRHEGGVASLVIKRNAAIVGNVSLSDDASSVTMAEGAAIDGDVSTGGGADSVVLGNGASIKGGLDLGDGADTLTIQGGGASLSGPVEFGAGDDRMIVSVGGFEASGVLRAGAGEDILTFGEGAAFRFGGADVLDGWERISLGRNASLAFGGDGSRRVNSVALEDTILDLPAGATLDFADGAADDTFTLTGRLNGGGTIKVDANFSGDGTADRLIIKERSSDGIAVKPDIQTVIDVKAIQGVGNPTAKEISVVRIEGHIDTNNEAFRLASGRIDAGAYDVSIALKRVSNENVHDYRLDVGARSLNSLGAVMERAPALIVSKFTTPPAMAERAIGRRAIGFGNPATGQNFTVGDMFDHSGDSWIRVYGDFMDYGTSSNGTEARTEGYGVRAGVDLVSFEIGSGDIVVGLAGQYSTVAGKVTSAVGDNGTVDSNGYGVAGMATWFGGGGMYLDAQTQISWIETEFGDSVDGVLASGIESTASFASLEIGKRFALDRNMSLVPHGQISLGGTDIGDFSVGNSDVKFNAEGATNARLGVAAEFSNERIKGFALAGIMRDFAESPEVTVGNSTLRDERKKTKIELGFGGSVLMSDETILFLEGSYQTTFGSTLSDDRGVSMSTGVQWKW